MKTDVLWSFFSVITKDLSIQKIIIKIVHQNAALDLLLFILASLGR